MTEHIAAFYLNAQPEKEGLPGVGRFSQEGDAGRRRGGKQNLAKTKGYGNP